MMLRILEYCPGCQRDPPSHTLSNKHCLLEFMSLLLRVARKVKTRKNCSLLVDQVGCEGKCSNVINIEVSANDYPSVISCFSLLNILYRVNIVNSGLLRAWRG